MTTSSKTSPAKKKVKVESKVPLGRPRKKVIDPTNATALPKLVVLGQGSLRNRRMHAIRLPEPLIERLQGVASGPLYLLLQIAVEHLCDDLQAAEGTIAIRAEDLDYPAE